MDEILGRENVFLDSEKYRECVEAEAPNDDTNFFSVVR
jgi:hypothetical protein